MYGMCDSTYISTISVATTETNRRVKMSWKWLSVTPLVSERSLGNIISLWNYRKYIRWRKCLKIMYVF
jgi:hypothetical protein